MMATNKTAPILEIRNLTIEYRLHNGVLRACDNVSLDIYRGEIVGVIGESGSGKTTLASGILKTIKPPGRITGGQIFYCAEDGTKTDIVGLTDNEYAALRWTNITAIFQAAQNVLNPSLKVKEHFLETVWAHRPREKESAILDKARELLAFVRLEERVLESYPHQLSGGMKQRTVIALSLVLDPDVLILDEPTTALDAITQWYIIDILKKIHDEKKITMIFMTHDISVISTIIDRIGVMYAGQIAEYGRVEEVFGSPAHPYTFGLLHTLPSLKDDLSKRRAIPGFPPNMLALPHECRFAPRCEIFLRGGCEGDGPKTDVTYETPEGQITRCYNWTEAKKLCL